MGEWMANAIVIAVLLISISAACAYIYKKKKEGSRCIGCAMGGKCPKKCGCDQI